ncbi:MAG: hypothetical protein II889_06990 [Clostridia bacterium]|nr:hypothetical protein [Clostridia bacterium]
MQTKPIEAQNGKYRWTYEMSLFKNPTIFIATAKAIGIAVAITIFIIGLISLIADGFSADIFRFLGELTLILVGIFAVLLVLGYMLYAAIMGGYYIVDFTMDEKTVVLSQSAKQAKKAENIGIAAMIMGAITHNRGAVSAGYNSSIRSTSITEFSHVKKVVIDKKHSVIKLHTIGWDHVYADGADFDFAADWIRRHIPAEVEWVVKS